MLLEKVDAKARSLDPVKLKKSLYAYGNAKAKKIFTPFIADAIVELIYLHERKDFQSLLLIIQGIALQSSVISCPFFGMNPQKGREVYAKFKRTG